MVAGGVKWSCGVGLVFLAVALAACSGRRSPAPGLGRGQLVYHRVAKGETLSAIGRTYGVAYSEIARVNRLTDPSRISIGQILLIPGSGGPSPHRRRSARRVRRRPDPKAPLFAWPVAGGTVTSGFGARNGSRHDGIDIAAAAGTPIRAAADGEVAYSGTLAGYGKVVILRHAAGYATVYAHNERNTVREGQRIRRGQSIARLGRTGRTSGPNLHFEVRKDRAAQDPLSFLPPSSGEEEAGAEPRRRQGG